MIEEEGIVIDNRDGKAVIMTQRTTACEGCASINICEMSPDSKHMTLLADNPINARKGDRVLIAIEDRSAFRLTFLTYLILLLAFIIGVFAGKLIENYIPTGIDEELLSALSGFVMLVPGFLVLRWLGRSMDKDKRLIPVIIKRV